MSTLRNRFRFGIVVHHTTVWISELYSMLFLGSLLIVLATLSTLVLINEVRISRQEVRIAELVREQALIHHDLDILRQKNRIASALRAFSQNRVEPELFNRIVELVFSNSRQYGYDPLLVLAVINTESIFDPRALGRFRSGEESGALGLMQLKFETAREIARPLGIDLTSRDDLFKPEVNIVLGIAYLTRMIAQFKNLKLGILAYNQGPGTVRGMLARREPLEWRYYEKVLKSYFRLKSFADQHQP